MGQSKFVMCLASLDTWYKHTNRNDARMLKPPHTEEWLCHSQTVKLLTNWQLADKLLANTVTSRRGFKKQSTVNYA